MLGSSPTGLSCTAISVLILLAFAGGIAIGSLLIETHIAQPLPSVGLPGTNNVLKAWTSASIQSNPVKLRGTILEIPLLSNAASTSNPVNPVQTTSSAISKQPAMPQTPLAPPSPPSSLTLPFTPPPCNLLQGCSHGFQADHQNSLVLPHMLDAPELLVAVWVYLDEQPDNDMRTVFSNKAPGKCVCVCMCVVFIDMHILTHSHPHFTP
ncbi:hypothetical protein EON65_58560, partial [archaeon]